MIEMNGQFRAVSLFLFILSFSAPSFAQQEEKLGDWLMYFGSTRLHENWSLHHEIQFRNAALVINTEQWLLRGGVIYHSPYEETPLISQANGIHI
ncbi:MAG: DUF2490 domain-containing protein, partial [Bacteroidia bacterium]